jgi:hypothetical protein
MRTDALKQFASDYHTLMEAFDAGDISNIDLATMQVKAHADASLYDALFQNFSLTDEELLSQLESLPQLGSLISAGAFEQTGLAAGGAASIRQGDIIIQGNADSSVIPLIESVLEKQARKLAAQLYQTSYKNK